MLFDVETKRFMRKRVLGTALILTSLAIAPVTIADEKPHHHHGAPQGQMQHGKLEIQDNKAVPTVDLEVFPDEMGGWNVQVKTTNFQFAPENLDKSSLPTEGHAHLYLNNKKLTRLYGNWHYLGNLPAGFHSVMVTLNTNRHEDLFHKGKRIEVTKRFIVFPAQAGK
jgi:hypothetical protein